MVVSAAFVLGVLSGNGFNLQGTLAQGYEGLIPGPTGSAAKNEGDHAGPGYYGVIPGSNDSRGGGFSGGDGVAEDPKKDKDEDVAEGPAQRGPLGPGR